MPKNARVRCPECRKSYSVHPDILGKKVLCAHCDKRVVATADDIYVGKGNGWGGIPSFHIETVEKTLLLEAESLQAIVSGRAKSVSTRADGFFRICEDPETNKGGNILKHYLIVTDRRVLVWARGAFKSSTDSLEYADITGIEQQNGFLYGGIVLKAHGSKVNFTEMNKPEAEVVAGLIRANLSIRHVPIANEAQTGDPLAQIEKLAELRDKGFITQDEFVAQKQKLLDQL